MKKLVMTVELVLKPEYTSTHPDIWWQTVMEALESSGALAEGNTVLVRSCTVYDAVTNAIIEEV